MTVRRGQVFWGGPIRVGSLQPRCFVVVYRVDDDGTIYGVTNGGKNLRAMTSWRRRKWSNGIPSGYSLHYDPEK